MTWRWLAPVWLTMGLAAGCGSPDPAGGRSEIEPVPLPADLGSLDAPVRDQLRERYAEVERRSAAVDRAESPETRVRLGRAFGELGQALAAYRYWQPAAAAFTNAEHLDPAPSWPYYRGYAERSLGRLEASNAALERFLVKSPQDVPALVWLGENQLDLGNLAAARERFQQALDANPQCVQALFGLGRVALEEGDPEAAAGHLEEAVSRQPGSSRIRYSLAQAFRQRGDEDLAATHFSKVTVDHLTSAAIALDDPLMAAVRELSQGAMAYERRGLRAAARGDMQRAAFELQQAVALDPDRTEAWHNLGLALLRMGRRQEGERELRRLLERRPGHAPTQVLLGKLAAGDGQMAEAEERFRAALAADSQLHEAHYNLAALLRRTGRAAEAREHAERAGNFSPAATGER